MACNTAGASHGTCPNAHVFLPGPQHWNLMLLGTTGLIVYS